MTQASNQYESGTNNQAATFDNMSHVAREQQPDGNVPRGTPTQHRLTESKMPSSPAHKSTAATEPLCFEEDIDDNPHSHFLSPVHMYESWDDSDDSDDDTFEFDAGITDFALFTEDYKRAKEQNVPLSDKWNDLLTDQAECYDRAVARTRAEKADRPAGPYYSGSSFPQPDAVPSLTPDTSPRLADDLEYDGSEDNADNRPYRTEIVTPESTRPASAPINIPRKQALNTLSESAIEDDDFEDPTAPAFLLYRHSQRTDRRRQPSKPEPPLVRPGLSAGGRTLSGKAHVWKRPSWDLFSVDEEREEEAVQDDSRGRTADGTLRKKKGMEKLRD